MGQTEQKQRHLVLDKITVPPVSPRFSRSRLLDVLRNNLSSCAATIVNGRAGTGKTTLTADFARHAGRAVAWYKVDAADSELREFAKYLLESLILQRPSIDPAPMLELADSALSDRDELLAESLIFRLSDSNAKPLLVVIEDLHHVYDADWVVPFFHRLLPLLPADVHVLITCRSIPPAPLWRMRSKQSLLVIDEPELAFTLDETIELFKRRGWDERRARFAWIRTNGRAGALASIADGAGSSEKERKDFHMSLGVVA